MIIFLVLILLLIGLFVAFIYLNVNKYYEVNLPRIAAGQEGKYFLPNGDYYTLKDSWKELSVGSLGIGETCYANITCSSGFCKYNPDTNQTKCTATTKGDGGFTQPSPYETESKGLYNYGEPYFYTAICAQKKVNDSIESYYPDFKSSTLINETLLGTPSEYSSNCEDYTFQQTPLETTSCYDVDQLAGTKIVELCQATIGTNQICTDNNGDRVYAPTLNSLYIKPSLTLCENNTSIEYITFNFNNVPQSINILNNTKEDGLDLFDNQIMCLSADSIGYYPNISITKYPDGTNKYYLTFTGTWGFKYSFTYASRGELSVSTNLQWYDPNALEGQDPTNTSNTLEMERRIQIDFDYGITYKIPGTVLTGAGFTMLTSNVKNTVYSYSSEVDIIEETSNIIKSGLSLQPCAIFNSSYDVGDNTNTQHLLTYVDKQKFKVSRFSATDGKMTPDENGIVSSIIYRNLNYENGGLYVDYYAPPTNNSNSTTPGYLSGVVEGLVLRKVNSKDVNATNVWLLIPPLELSPYTIPSGKDMWCNYCRDVSTDGGNTFNNKNSVVVPMLSNNIAEGTEIIDPNYNNLVKQPDNKIFQIAGDIMEGAAIAANGGDVVADAIEIYKIAKNPNANWHLLRNDPSFGKCSQICGKVIQNGTTPLVKAVAINSGTLGSVPPGHTRGITRKFAEGNVIDGIKLGGQTCQNYYLYNENSDNRTISSRSVGDTYIDGNVEFVVQGTYDNTYMFRTSYFNNKGTIVIDNISSPGTGYGITTPPKNVISSLTPTASQQFIYSLPSQNTPTTTTKCTITTTTSQCTIGTISNSTLCAQPDVELSDSIISKILSQLNATTQTFEIEVGTTKVPVIIFFSSPVCNSLYGLENFYNAATAVVGFPVQNGSTNNTIDISKSNLSKLFPTVSDISNTKYEAISSKTSTNGFKLYDNKGKPLELTATYADFRRQYRLYSGNNYVANVNITTSSNGAIESNSVDILEITDEATLLADIDSDFDVQEWWVLPITYGRIIMNIEYHNPNATKGKIKLQDNVTDWDILQPAPKELYKDDVLKFPSITEPMNLSNNSVLRHGLSPQQIVYGGTFQQQTEYCYAKYPQSETDTSTNKTNIDDCNNDPKCSFNENLGYCQGKTLIEYGSEKLKNPFTISQNFSGSVFNDIKTTQDSTFTDLTFFKSLQIPGLNYMSYKSMNNQTVEGGTPTYYYTPPEFINYKNQNISSSDTYQTKPVPVPALGKFIPYQYFYPNSMSSENEEENVNQLEIVETSTLKDNVKINKQITQVNNFYVNLNYSQFIPYGKKSLYENGFTKQSDVPTF